LVVGSDEDDDDDDDDGQVNAAYAIEWGEGEFAYRRPHEMTPEEV
jgi:hypothetical protein